MLSRGGRLALASGCRAAVAVGLFWFLWKDLEFTGPQGIGGKMKFRFCVLVLGLFTLMAFKQPVLAQQPAAQVPPREDSSYIDEEGTACLPPLVSFPPPLPPPPPKPLPQHT